MKANFLILLISLMILLSSCVHRGTGVQFDIPVRSELPTVKWASTENSHCIDDNNAKALLKREAIRDTYEIQLKDTILQMNKALK